MLSTAGVRRSLSNSGAFQSERGSNEQFYQDSTREWDCPGCHCRTPTHDTHTVHQPGSSLTYEHTTSINLKKKIQA